LGKEKMNIAKSSHGDPRLTGEGKPRVWAWIRSVLLVLVGFLLIYPGGIAIGLAFGRGPDFTAFSTYIWMGLTANLVVAVILVFLKKKFQALWLSSSGFLILGIELLRHL
jgi:hypothetical protein